MNPTATKVVAGVVLFLSGAVMGYFGSRLLVDRGKMAMLQHGDPRHFAEMFLRRMTGDLDLSEAQQAKLRPIVMNTSEKLIEIRREQEPKVHETIEKSIADTKAVLTPEQLVKFTSIIERLEKRRKDMERFGPPPPPPGMGPPDMDGFPPPPPPPPGMEGFPPPPGMGPPPGMDGFPPPPPGLEGLWPGPDLPPGQPAPESKTPPASKEPAAAKAPAATNVPATPEKDAATPAPAPTAPAAGGNG